jgi:splicing suppressor protein 51
MRQEDDFKLENKPRARSVYTGASSSIEPFREYLGLAATRHNLLPPWWNAEKQKACEAFGESGVWNDLRRKVTKAEMNAHYGDEKMAMQVRMLAEVVYGRGTMGQDGSLMRKMQSEMENGGLGNGMVTSMINVAR